MVVSSTTLFTAVDDTTIIMAVDIYGPDIGSLKRKMKRSKSEHINKKKVEKSGVCKQDRMGLTSAVACYMPLSVFETITIALSYWKENA
jgi:hypothetical protein